MDERDQQRKIRHRLAVAGEAGVARMLEIYRTDIDRTLALVGRPRFDHIGPDLLV